MNEDKQQNSDEELAKQRMIRVAILSGLAYWHSNRVKITELKGFCTGFLEKHVPKLSLQDLRFQLNCLVGNGTINLNKDGYAIT